MIFASASQFHFYYLPWVNASRFFQQVEGPSKIAPSIWLLNFILREGSFPALICSQLPTTRPEQSPVTPTSRKVKSEEERYWGWPEPAREQKHQWMGKHEARSRYGHSISIYTLQSALQWDSMHHREKVEVRKYVKHFQWEKVYWDISKQEMNCALLSIIQPSSDRFNIYTVDTKCCSLHCMSWLVFSVNLFLVWGGRHPLAVLQGIFLSKKLIGLMSFTVIVPYLSRERGALWSILT